MLYAFLNNNVSNSIKVLSLQNLCFKSVYVFEKINEIMQRKNYELTISLKNFKFKTGFHLRSVAYVSFDNKNFTFLKIIYDNNVYSSWNELKSCTIHNKKSFIINNKFLYKL